MRAVALALALVACGKAAPPVPLAGSGSGSAVAVVPIDAAAPDATPMVVDAAGPDAYKAGDVMGEPIGPIRTGMTEAEVEQAIGKPKRRTPVEHEAAIGTYFTAWTYATGETIALRGDTKTGPFKVATIEILAPSTWKTSRGIGLGDKRAAVEAAYRSLVNKDESHAEGVVADSIYGGVQFAIENGTVAQICACAAF